MNRQLNIEVKDSIFDPSLPPGAPRQIWRNQKYGSPFYKVWLYLDGPDLPYVQCVTYELHETFPEPIRKIVRTLANPNCRLAIWTWGIFEVKVVIQDRESNSYHVMHKLNYGDELEKAQGVKIVDIDEDPRSFELKNMPLRS
jgi:hypothetical protein